MHIQAAVLFTLFLCVGAQAQQVFVVGGPGANFADLPEAVAAAAPGDILDVVPGSYTGFTATKGIHILGRPGGITIARTASAFEPSLGVVNVPRGESFTLRNVTLVDNGIFRNIVRLCEGNVVLDEVEGHWTIDRCANVQMTECTAFSISNAVEVVASNLTLDRCNIQTNQILIPIAGIQASWSKITVSQCDVRGNTGMTGQPSSAIFCAQPCELILTGFPPEGLIAAGPGSVAGATPAVNGTATVLLDPRLPVVGAHGGPAFGPQIQTTTTSIPTLRVEGGAPGGNAQVQLNGPAGETYLVALGLPAPPRQIPQFLGQFQLAFPAVDSMGVIPASGQVDTMTMIPNNPALLGLQISRQSITTSGNELPRFSNPATYTIRL